MTFGQHPDGHWGLAHSAEQAKEMGKLADLRAELDELKGEGEKQK